MNKLKVSLIASSTILFTNLIFRLINQSQMMFTFPFDGTDWATHIFELWALGQFGFHGLVEHWYNGYILFKFYNPGWYFFSFPLLKLFGDPLVASFISIIILFALLLCGLFALGKVENFSKIQVFAFFAFFAANAIAISNFIRDGRTPEFMAWVIFIPLLALLLYYRNKPVDYKFLLFIPLVSALLLSHFVISILFGFLLAGFILIKPFKEQLYIFASGLVSIGLISFWLIPLLRDIGESNILALKYADRFYDMSLFSIILNIALPLIMLILFIIYWRQCNYDKKEFLFFFPTIVFTFLLIFKLIPLIPLLNNIYPDPTTMFFIFFSVYFFLKIKLGNSKIIALVAALLILFAIGNVAINILDTDLFPERTEFQEELLSSIPKIDGRYMIAGKSPEFINWGVYSYAAIYHNKKTLWGAWQTTGYSTNYEAKVASTYNLLQEGNCGEFKKQFADLNSNNIIGIGETCNILQNCGFFEKAATKSACLYKTEL
ncbi:MAG: hypothetical protein AABW84_00635 [Nanoarchaeota archaeon]